jgi:hypothetical protein
LDFKSATASAAATVILSLPVAYAPLDDTVNARPVDISPGVFDYWVLVPSEESRPAPRAQRLTQAVREWTGWSNRKLAGVLRTSHPTVAALEQGRSAGRVGDLFERLVELHGVVQRIFLVANRDASEVDRLLVTPSAAGPTAADLLADRRPAEAYLAALEVNRPRRTGPMMRGIWPTQAGRATVDLADEFV